MLHISFGITAYISFHYIYPWLSAWEALQTVPQSAWYPGSPSFPAAPTVTAAAMF